MKKILLSIFALIFLSGCATYKFQRGQPPYDGGYVAKRNNFTIVEYTVGKDNTAPDLEVAKERFKRRKATVEEYYEKMGYIESTFKENFLNPPIMIAKLIGGFFRLPFIAMNNRKYNNDPKYREQVKKQEDEKYAAEKNRKIVLKEELSSYIQKDLDTEVVRPKVVQAPVVEETPAVEEKSAVEEPKKEVSSAVPSVSEPAKKPSEKKFLFFFKKKPPKEKAEVKPQVKEVRKEALAGQPTVVILAKPAKGYSPLRVRFNGTKSRSPNGRIIAYEWDFGDGDKSTKPEPLNTYYSASFEPKQFTATLTVTDSKGATASSSIEIEVINK